MLAGERSHGTAPNATPPQRVPRSHLGPEPERQPWAGDDASPTGIRASPAEEFGLLGSELLVGQDALILQFRKLLEAGDLPTDRRLHGSRRGRSRSRPAPDAQRRLRRAPGVAR